MNKLVLLFVICFATSAVSDDNWYSQNRQLQPKQLPQLLPQYQPQQPSPTQPKPPKHQEHQYPELQYRASGRSNVSDYYDIAEEKRFQALTVGTDLFWIDSTNGELWKFDRENKRWEFLGRPRGANDGRKGTFLLTALAPEELLILDTNTGEAWWINGDEVWVAIDDPSTRTRR